MSVEWRPTNRGRLGYAVQTEPAPEPAYRTYTESVREPAYTSYAAAAQPRETVYTSYQNSVPVVPVGYAQPPTAYAQVVPQAVIPQPVPVPQPAPVVYAVPTAGYADYRQPDYGRGRLTIRRLSDDDITEYRHGIRVVRDEEVGRLNRYDLRDVIYRRRPRSVSPVRRSVTPPPIFRRRSLTPPRRYYLPPPPPPDITFSRTVVEPPPPVLYPPTPPSSYGIRKPLVAPSTKPPLPPRKPRNWTIDRPMAIMFILSGILNIICAIINILICTEHNYYCRFWTGIPVLAVGILGFVHKADYYKHWKTYAYVIVGILASILCYVATALILKTIVRQILTISRYNDINAYVAAQGLGNSDSTVNMDPATRTWVCLITDWLFLVGLVTSYYTMMGAIEVANSHYNVHYHYDRNFYECDPYCYPKWFNPWSQVPIAMVVIFIGMVTVYVAEGANSDWLKYWTPIIAGCVAIIGGALAGSARKRPDNLLLTIAGIVAEMLTLLVCITACAFMILALIDISNLIKNSTFLDDFTRRVLTAGAVFVGFTLVSLLVLAVYCIGVLVRLISNVFHRDRFQTDPHQKRVEDYTDEQIRTVPRDYPPDPYYPRHDDY